jgi:hypothetical protein
MVSQTYAGIVAEIGSYQTLPLAEIEGAQGRADHARTCIHLLGKGTGPRGLEQQSSLRDSPPYTCNKDLRIHSTGSGIGSQDQLDSQKWPTTLKSKGNRCRRPPLLLTQLWLII